MVRWVVTVVQLPDRPVLWPVCSPQACWVDHNVTVTDVGVWLVQIKIP